MSWLKEESMEARDYTFIAVIYHEEIEIVKGVLQFLIVSKLVRQTASSQMINKKRYADAHHPAHCLTKEIGQPHEFLPVKAQYGIEYGHL